MAHQTIHQHILQTSTWSHRNTKVHLYPDLVWVCACTYVYTAYITAWLAVLITIKTFPLKFLQRHKPVTEVVCGYAYATD